MHFYPSFLSSKRHTAQALGACLVLALAAGCSSRPTAPPTAPAAAAPPATPSPKQTPTLGLQASTAERLRSAMPADLLLLGEQHDAPEHQQVQRDIVQALATSGRLAALALEMADAGNSTTGLPADSSEFSVRQALQWNEKGWPWAAYGPAVMAAVHAGVPVLGANLPRVQMRGAMAEPTLDSRLPAPAWQVQQQAIRSGHCNLLPETQTVPMARIQIAKDISMAHTLVSAVQPGKMVVLLAGSGHVDRLVGVPQHLPTAVSAKAVRLQAGAAADSAPSVFDVVWLTPAVPFKDYCASLKK